MSPVIENISSALPLKVFTPDSWAEAALSDPMALLSDHAYLEKKAASNALELLNRWPEPHYPEDWVKTLSSIARDEALHLDQVSRLIKKRGGRLSRLHLAGYPSDLRKLVRRGLGRKELVDRLLVSALIEARSCERFDILGRKAGDEDLRKFYRSLCASELTHFQVFLRLAESIPGVGSVSERWDYFLTEEAVIIRSQKPGPKIHSGWITPRGKGGQV